MGLYTIDMNYENLPPSKDVVYGEERELIEQVKKEQIMQFIDKDSESVYNFVDFVELNKDINLVLSGRNWEFQS